MATCEVNYLGPRPVAVTITLNLVEAAELQADLKYIDFPHETTLLLQDILKDAVTE